MKARFNTSNPLAAPTPIFTSPTYVALFFAPESGWDTFLSWRNKCSTKARCNVLQWWRSFTRAHQSGFRFWAHLPHRIHLALESTDWIRNCHIWSRALQLSQKCARILDFCWLWESHFWDIFLLVNVNCPIHKRALSDVQTWHPLWRLKE